MAAGAPTISQLGDILWNPPAQPGEATQIGRYLGWLGEHRGLSFDNYVDLHRWSVSDLEGFWGSLWDFFGVHAGAPHDRVLRSRAMPGAQWFTGARLNYAEHMLGGEGDSARVAIIAHSQTRATIELTFAELREQVAAARAGLAGLGVGPGDRVVGYLPNIPETLVAFLATASLGAIWAACPPEFGPRSVIDRFSMLAPKVLFAVVGYRYGERPVDRRAEVAELRAALVSVEQVVHVPYAGGEDDTLAGAVGWEQLLSAAGALGVRAGSVRSSALRPLLLRHDRAAEGDRARPRRDPRRASQEPRPQLGHRRRRPPDVVHDDGLDDVERARVGASAARVDRDARRQSAAPRPRVPVAAGRAAAPDADGRRAGTVDGVPQGGCQPAGVRPGSIRQLCAAGSPLPPEGYDWVYEQLGPELLLNVGSGGTDVCSGIVQGGPRQPVYRGEISGCALGVDVAAFDAAGQPVIGELGELVIRAPMPSMPVRFWNDPGGERYRATYFDEYPGIWRHGDWITFTQRGSCVIAGRSDATLNRGGVRLGTGEFYPVIEALDEIVDSLVVHLEDPQGGPGELMLFVVLADGVRWDDALRAKIVAALRGALSPRHVPDVIEAVPAIPRTLTAKKLELPVKRILLGARASEVASRDALADPHALDAFVEIAARRRAPGA